MTAKEAKPTKGENLREKRLAEALRANLARRKAQMRSQKNSPDKDKDNKA
jgi:hypothetical protein